MIKQQEFDFSQAEINKRDGMNRAELNAEHLNSGWHSDALQHLTEFLEINPGSFMAENVRAWADRRGLPAPPSLRAWGAVIMKASKMKMIEFVGYEKTTSAKSNGTPASVWRKRN
jgi:hypothetical protein